MSAFGPVADIGCLSRQGPLSDVKRTLLGMGLAAASLGRFPEPSANPQARSGGRIRFAQQEAERIGFLGLDHCYIVGRGHTTNG